MSRVVSGANAFGVRTSAKMLRIFVREQKEIWSSEKGSMVDALELLYEEGRGKLR